MKRDLELIIALRKHQENNERDLATKLKKEFTRKQITIEEIDEIVKNLTHCSYGGNSELSYNRADYLKKAKRLIQILKKAQLLHDEISLVISNVDHLVLEVEVGDEKYCERFDVYKKLISIVENMERQFQPRKLKYGRQGLTEREVCNIADAKDIYEKCMKFGKSKTFTCELINYILGTSNQFLKKALDREVSSEFYRVKLVFGKTR